MNFANTLSLAHRLTSCYSINRSGVPIGNDVRVVSNAVLGTQVMQKGEGPEGGIREYYNEGGDRERGTITSE